MRLGVLGFGFWVLGFGFWGLGFGFVCLHDDEGGNAAEGTAGRVIMLLLLLLPIT